MNVKWLSKGCRQQKQVSLLVSGLLPESDKAALKAHLQTCPQCQLYHDELMQLNQGIVRLKEGVSQVAPGARLHNRWTRQVLESSDLPGKSSSHGVRMLKTIRQWYSLPRLAFVGGFAAAICLVIVFAANHWRPQSNTATGVTLLQNSKLIHETLAMFPGRVRAITQDERGLNLVLSEKANVPSSTPLYVHVCDRKHCESFVTFSGQEIQVAGQKVSVLSDAQGRTILVGEDFFWSNKDKVHSGTHLEIEAKNLDPLPM